jgi:hypothetical protein
LTHLKSGRKGYARSGIRQSVTFRIWLGVLSLGAVAAPPVAAQSWDSPAATAVVSRAVLRRSALDSSLHAWTASAHGTLEFLVDLGDAAILPPRVVKVEEIASSVYWRQPGISLQRIVGKRDTTLLPGDVGFYSDRYGVITNNLGDQIRLGDGNDVRDLPHPLSPTGRQGYSFAIADSLSIALPGRQVEAYELLLRPRDPDAPGMVGSMYIDRATGDLVRLAVTFTRNAILDQRIERLALVLENLLVDGRFWLPYRQEVEVVRVNTWFDFPVKGIVRAHWIVSDHAAFADTSAVPPPPPTTGHVLEATPSVRIVVAPPAERQQFHWDKPILDVMDPADQAVTDAEVRAVRKQAESLVQQRVLARATGASIGGRGISDFAHVNRVEGLGLGVDGRVALTASWRASARLAYGFSDEQVKGGLELSHAVSPTLRVTAFGGRLYRDAGDVAEVSGVRNTLAAQILGDDDTDPYDVYTAGLRLNVEPVGAVTWDIRLAVERQDSLSVNASPWSGTYEPTIPALSLDAIRLDVGLVRQREVSASGNALGWRIDGRLEAWSPRDGAPDGVTGRLAASLTYIHPLGSPELHLETHAAVVSGGTVPSQELVRLGGMVTGPGFQYHEFAAQFGVSQRAELRVPVPFVSVPLPWIGKSPPTATLAPYAVLVCVVDRQSPSGASVPDGCFPTVGVGFMTFFDTLRFDVAYGFRDGGWRFGVDAARFLWGVL